MTQRGALSCLMLSDQVYQNKLLYSEKMLCKWGLWRRKAWKSDPYVLCRSCPRHREVWAAVGVKDNANFKKGGTFSKVLNSVGMKTVCVLGARVRHQGIPCHLRCCSLGSSISCHRPLQWGYVCNKQLLCNYLLLLWLLWFMHWNGIIWGV